MQSFGGIWGAIATGLFATTKVIEAGANGLFFGGGLELWINKRFPWVPRSFSVESLHWLLLKSLIK